MAGFIKSFFSCVVTASLFLGIAAFEAEAQARRSTSPVVLQINSGLPVGSFEHELLKEFKRRVESELPGQIDVQIFMGNVLGDELDVLRGLEIGTHHASLSATHTFSLNQRAAVFELPYLFKDRDDVQKFAASPAGDMIADGFSKLNMRLAAVWDNGFRVITNNVRPIRVPEDLQGVKIRTPQSRQRMRLFSTLGANPTPMAFGEVYSALDQGVIDGQENPVEVALSASLYSVQKYMSLSRHVYSPAFFLFGQPYLARLKPDMRDKLLQIAAEMASWTFELGEQSERNALKKLEELMEVNEVDMDAFRLKVLPLYEDSMFVDRIGKEMMRTTLECLGIVK